MLSFWQKIFGKNSSVENDQRSFGLSSDRGWNIGSRPSHSDRFAELQGALAQEVFAPSEPKRNAYFFVAGFLNQQIALLQTAQILDGNGETCLRMPFALGYVFGVAAWTSDKHEIARPSDDADELVLLAYQEILGPLPKEYISQLSGSASQWPEFHDGVEFGARDAMQFSQGITKDVTGLAQFIARCRSTSSLNPAGK